LQVLANGLGIEVDMRDVPGGAPLLMIMGLGMQLVAWPAELVRELSARGLAPVMFDNRDAGLSTRFESAGVPNLMRAGLLYSLRLPVRVAYSLEDMARDAIGVMDALAIDRAHVLGVSMGGMIAQLMAARAPERVRSLGLIMTTSGARHLPGPTLQARAAMLSRPRGRDFDAQVAHAIGIWNVVGSPAYPPDPQALRTRVEQAIRRAYYPQGLARQLAAVIASGDRSALLGRIRAPTLVVHGRADPLVPAACGADLARKIGGARLEIIDGMGHDLPAPLAPRLAALVAEHCGRA
jgi:pimeloyl-ACP methyl ester carboxylesterase